jgi:hypothetical protein
MNVRRALQQHSMHQSRWLFTRKQGDLPNAPGFQGGMVADRAVVPENAVRYLANFENRGTTLIGRPGCQLWSATPLPGLPGRAGYSWTKAGDVVTKTVGTAWTVDDIGAYLVHDDGAHERIRARLSDSQVRVHSDTPRGPSTAGWMRGAVNGTYVHKTDKKLVLHIDTRLFLADADLSAYTEVPCISYDLLGDAHSVMDEFDQYVVIFSSAGIFRCDVSAAVPLYYRLNSPVPSIKLTNAGEQSEETPYGRRRIYVMLRLTGEGPRNRTTSGVIVEAVSGPTLVDENYIDYGESWVAEPIDEENPEIVGDLAIPVDPQLPAVSQYHWTHYGVYAPLDIGENGTDPITGEANIPDRYTWLGDYPVAKAFTVSRTDNVVTSTEGVFEPWDEGTEILFEGGDSDTITAYIDEETVETEGSGALSSRGAAIGGGTPMSASQEGATVTISGGYVFAADDVRRTIFWADGGYSHIVAVLTATTATVHASATRGAQGAVVGAVSRKFSDTVPDDTLRARTAGFPLRNRLWRNLPQCNTGRVVPGFLFAALREGRKYYYSQIPTGFEYLMGYYNAALQEGTVKDGIIEFKEFPGTLVIRCQHSTVGVPINTFAEIRVDKIGEVVAALTAQWTIDHTTGAQDYGGNVFADQMKELVVTQTAELKLFDGSAYGPNLADGKMMEFLRSLSAAYQALYHPEYGYFLWGLDEQ